MNATALYLAAGLLVGIVWECREEIREWVDLFIELLTPPPSPTPSPYGRMPGFLAGLAAYDVQKDQQRQAMNLVEFGSALLGDPHALSYLLQRSGRNGTVEVPGYGLVGGWASQSARDDAWKKFIDADTTLAERGA